MECINCGAPLSPSDDLCQYCGSLNDTDLRRLYDSHVERLEASDEACPRCDGAKLLGLKIVVPPEFVVHRCAKCLGMWFDPGELDPFVDAAVKIETDPDDRRLQTIREEAPTPRPIRYIPCPVCHELMQRRDFALSGVIMNTCKDHGAWLDGGDLGQILRWARAGGLQKAARTEVYEKRMQQADALGQAAMLEHPAPAPSGGLVDLVAKLLLG